MLLYQDVERFMYLLRVLDFREENKNEILQYTDLICKKMYNKNMKKE